MNKIEKLIEQLCPKGVKFKELGEIVRISNGKDHKHLDEGTIPVYGSGGIMRYANQFMYNEASVLIPRKGSIGNIYYLDTPFWVVDTIFYTKINTEIIVPKFLFYCLKNKNLAELNFAGGVPSLTKTILDKLSIPIPPLPIQQEIVSILDKFTDLEAELEAELEARTCQFDYYRNQLLDFEEKEVEWRTLGEIGKFKYGYTDKAKERGNVRFIRITDIDENGKLREKDRKYLEISENNKEYLLKKGDILMARTGATFGKTMLFNENYDAIYASFLIKIQFDVNVITPSFYWHYAQSGLYWEQAKKYVSGGAQPQFNANVLKLIKIPIPPLSEQERIVSILDKFDALVNDISVGLPAEISARRKQYEYYRGMLLNFNNINN